MDDEYQRQEFWFKKKDKETVSVYGISLMGDSLSKIIRTQKEADEFMTLLKKCGGKKD